MKRAWIRTDEGFCERTANVQTFEIVPGPPLRLKVILRRGAGGPYHTTVTGLPALEFIMAEAPHLLEGVPGARRGKWAWAVHNLFGHPLMQLAAFLGLRQLAFKIHDKTVPWPKTATASSTSSPAPRKGSGAL